MILEDYAVLFVNSERISQQSNRTYSLQALFEFVINEQRQVFRRLQVQIYEPFEVGTYHFFK